MLPFYSKKPLKDMIRRIRAYDAGAAPLDLPVNRSDEIGELAGAFTDLIGKFDTSRRAEEKARARLQAVVDNTVDGLITIDGRGRIETFNKACEYIFGYAADEVVGRNVKILMPEPYHGEHDGYLRNYHETGDKKIIGIGREVEGRRKDGSVFPLDLSVSEVNIGGQKVYSGIVRDITERKKSEKEIMRSNDELERFAYIASHDLQEPLRIVANFTDLLKEEYGGDMDDQALQYMEFIVDASRRMQRLVSDLLAYSRIGSEETGFVSFDGREQIDRALENLEESRKETKAKIIIGEMPVIYANPLRFSRLMQNLISNAVKYRAPARTPEILIEAEDLDEEWLFCVRDNGIGIKPEYHDQIFVIFKRLHNKSDYDGTGIGLAICRKVVENFGGRIWVESEFGEGSAFFFTIPKPQSERKEHGIASRQANRHHAGRGQ